MTLHILSGGAANGLVSAITDRFRAETGHDIVGEFGAVGAMRERLLGGAPADVVILTRKLMHDLADEGHVDRDSLCDLGDVATAVGVREGDVVPDVSSPSALRKALVAAGAIYVPDTGKATAGIHVAKVLAELGIADSVSARLREYPNGQTAMAALVAGGDVDPVGCTQITEILNTPGMKYVGNLPAPHGLSTTYTAAVASGSANAEHARTLIALLTDSDTAPIRRSVGFA